VDEKAAFARGRGRGSIRSASRGSSRGRRSSSRGWRRSSSRGRRSSSRGRRSSSRGRRSSSRGRSAGGLGCKRLVAPRLQALDVHVRLAGAADWTDALRRCCRPA
jgi:hypothetical protein